MISTGASAEILRQRGIPSNSGLEVVPEGSTPFGKAVSIKPGCYELCLKHNPDLAKICTDLGDHYKDCPTFKRKYGRSN